MKKRIRPRRAELIHAVQELEPRQLLSYSISSDSAVVMNTSLGEIAIQLYNDGTEPQTITNFLSYVAAGTYNGTVFHRVTSNGDSNGDTFGIVQGGGFTDSSGTLTPVAVNAAIPLEATPAHPNSTGTIAMARTSGLNSATSQFFFNTTDNSTTFDNNSADSTYNPYTAFGNVIRGLGIVDTIDGLSTSNSVTSSDGESLNPPETSTGGFVTINTAAEEDTMTVTIGPHDAAGDHTVSFRDPTTGSGTNISLTGADATLTFTGTDLAAKRGNGNLVVTGTNLELQEIASTDTTAKTNLVFSSPGRTKHINVGDINITGSINSISGGGVNLTGDVAVTGSVSKIALLSTNAAGFISLDTDEVKNAPATYIDIPFLSDISIQSGGPIKELITRSYVVDDGTNRGMSSNGAITKVQDYGALEAGVDAASVGDVKAAEISSFIDSNGTINSVTTGQFQGGGVYSSQAYDAKTVNIKTVKVKGSVSGAQFISAGNIGSISAASMSGSIVSVGYDTSGDDQAQDSFQYPLASLATLKSVSLKTPKSGDSFSDSEIQAGVIDSLHLGRVATTVPSSSTYSVMGIQTTDLKSLTATTDQRQSLDFSNITTQSALNTAVSKRGLNLSISAILGSALTSGTAYKSITLKSPLGASLANGSSLTITSGANVQTITLSAAANPGDTKLAITSITPSASYPVGSIVAAPGSFTFDIITTSQIGVPSSASTG